MPHCITQIIPGGNGADGGRATWTKPRRGERTGVRESIVARSIAFSRRVSFASTHTSYPRRESNPHLRFRKPPFYPLNYGDVFPEIRYRISEVRFQITIGTPRRNRMSRRLLARLPVLARRMTGWRAAGFAFINLNQAERFAFVGSLGSIATGEQMNGWTMPRSR
jgi:hypothetical protein